MSGHSKWANIKARKGAQDVKRGKAFTKIIKEIIMSSRIGGGVIENNPRLRSAIQEARGNNVPKDTVERAIQRGTGQLEGSNYEEITYEGYGSGGVAIIVETATDNKNRTSSDIRHLFSKYGGNLGESGCVSWNFKRMGIITIKRDAVAEDKLFEIVTEAGAEDLDAGSELYEVRTKASDLSAIAEAIEKAKIPVESSKLGLVPNTIINITGDGAKGLFKLLDALEDNDDVQNVWSNFDIEESEVEKISQ